MTALDAVAICIQWQRGCSGLQCTAAAQAVWNTKKTSHTTCCHYDNQAESFSLISCHSTRHRNPIAFNVLRNHSGDFYPQNRSNNVRFYWRFQSKHPIFSERCWLPLTYVINGTFNFMALYVVYSCEQRIDSQHLHSSSSCSLKWVFSKKIVLISNWTCTSRSIVRNASILASYWLFFNVELPFNSLLYVCFLWMCTWKKKLCWQTRLLCLSHKPRATKGSSKSTCSTGSCFTHLTLFTLIPLNAASMRRSATPLGRNGSRSY